MYYYVVPLPGQPSSSEAFAMQVGAAEFTGLWAGYDPLGRSRRKEAGRHGPSRDKSSFSGKESLMRLDAIAIGKDPPRDINVIIEVPVGGEPSMRWTRPREPWSSTASSIRRCATPETTGLSLTPCRPTAIRSMSSSAIRELSFLVRSLIAGPSACSSCGTKAAGTKRS